MSNKTLSLNIVKTKKQQNKTMHKACIKLYESPRKLTKREITVFSIHQHL